MGVEGPMTSWKPLEVSSLSSKSTTVTVKKKVPAVIGVPRRSPSDCRLIPGGSCSIAQAYLQVCLHSQGHRSQCASRLRALGGQPPVTDFIVWLTDRPQAQWS